MTFNIGTIFSKLPVRSFLLNCAYRISTSTVLLKVTDHLLVRTHNGKNGSCGTRYPTLPRSIPLAKLCSECPVYLRCSCLLISFSRDISYRRHFGIDLLIYILIPTKRLAWLFTSFPTQFPTAAFCSTYLLRGSTLVFCSKSSLFL